MFLAPQPIHSLLSQTLSGSWFQQCPGPERLQPSPENTAIPRPWLLAAARHMALPSAEGTEARLGTKVWLLQQLLPKGDFVSSKKWLPLQTCTARSARLGGDAREVPPGEPRPPTTECCHRHALTYSYTCLHIHLCTGTHTLT